MGRWKKTTRERERENVDWAVVGLHHYVFIHAKVTDGQAIMKKRVSENNSAHVATMPEMMPDSFAVTRPFCLCDLEPALPSHLVRSGVPFDKNCLGVKIKNLPRWAVAAKGEDQRGLAWKV